MTLRLVVNNAKVEPFVYKAVPSFIDFPVDEFVGDGPSDGSNLGAIIGDLAIGLLQKLEASYVVAELPNPPRYRMFFWMPEAATDKRAALEEFCNEFGVEIKENE